MEKGYDMMVETWVDHPLLLSLRGVGVLLPPALDLLQTQKVRAFLLYLEGLSNEVVSRVDPQITQEVLHN